MSSVRYLIGKTLNKYDVLDHIGHGGMSEVYLGQQAKLDRKVAIKVLHPFLADEAGFVVRFEREAKIVATLRHPNIVQVYDFDHDEELDIYFMVMEYIDGSTLKNRLEESTLSPMEMARVGAAIADALDYAHQRSMVHRDIKPANIMFLDEHQPVLTDFGIAKMLTLSGLTASGAMVGTPAYMAPEIGLGNPGTASSDIYSLSVVLYQAVAGCLPFTAETPMGMVMQHINKTPPSPSLYNPDIPVALEKVILRGLKKEPADRYATAGEMATALREAFGLPAADGTGEAMLAASRRPVEPVDGPNATPTPGVSGTPAPTASTDGPAAPSAEPERTAGSGLEENAPRRERLRLWPILRTAFLLLVVVGIGGGIAYTLTEGVPPAIDALFFGLPTATPQPVATATVASTALPTEDPTEPSPEPTATEAPAVADDGAAPTPVCAIRVRLDNIDMQPSASVGPGANVVAYITLRNSGTCAWPKGSKMVFAEGDALSAPESYPVAALAPGEKIQFIVPMEAPEELGDYRSIWELRKSDGNSLGSGSSGRITVDLSVEDLPAVDPTPIADLAFVESTPSPIVVSETPLLSWEMAPAHDVWFGTAQVMATGGTGVYAVYQDRISAESELVEGVLSFEWRRCEPFPLNLWILSGAEILNWRGDIAYPDPAGCP